MIAYRANDPDAEGVLMNEEFWRAVRMKERNSNDSRRTGAVNIAILFGTAAIALTLILTPMLASRDGPARLASVTIADPYDNIATGSIPAVAKDRTESANGKRYVIRRSVLQDNPESYCIVRGYQSGEDC